MGEQINELVRALLGSPEKYDAPASDAAPERTAASLDSLVAIASVAPSLSSGSSGAVDLSLRMDQLRATIASQTGAVTENTVAVKEGNTVTGSAPASGTSTVSSALKTIGSVTSIGLGPVVPLVSGLMKLFGNDDKNTETPLTPFALPEAVRIGAGLDGARNLRPIRYAQNGLPQSTEFEARQTPVHSISALPPITVNVQAMDSRSFVDRSDDIARAVRDAMLHAHALNDVVADV